MFDKLRGEPHYFDFPHEIIKIFTIFTIFQKRSCQNIKVVLYLKLPNKTLQFNIGDFLLSYGYIVLFLYSFMQLYVALCSRFRIVKNAISNQIDCVNMHECINVYL